MSKTHAVGIDLGTTYSCIAYLNEHGEPVTLANAEGEFSTPSAVLIDGTEIIVGTEAIRNAILRPEDVILNAKRYIGDGRTKWTIQGREFTPVDAESLVLKKLIGDAQQQIGLIEEAVITVPAQFSDAQRHETIEAGIRAGLQRVDIINEPVAASLCHVLGTEGMWFSELADDQTILVYDLGGGTFDLSLVKYRKDEVSVIASSGDLMLGGNDWTTALMNAIAGQFAREFDADPRDDLTSKQALMLETEQAKRSLSVRPKTALTVQHSGHRKSYQVEQKQFETISKPLIDRTLQITKGILSDNKMGWARVDAVLLTGGSSRMPMIRDSVQKLSGRTLNTSLSPDQSIAHGATYYAGMLLSNDKFARSILSDEARARLARVKQQSVTARSLGILVRDMQADKKVPHYLIPANAPLPVEVKHLFGTVVANQKRVNLQVIESGPTKDKPHERIGQCVIEGLPQELPEGSIIEVTIRYDAEAKVHVSARDAASGKEASTEIVRRQNVKNQLEVNDARDEEVVELEPCDDEDAHILIENDEEETATASPTIISGDPLPPPIPKPQPAPVPTPQPKPKVQAAPYIAPKPKPIPQPQPAPKPKPQRSPSSAKIDKSDRPIPLCNRCGEPLTSKGDCPTCGPVSALPPQKKKARPPQSGGKRPVGSSPQPPRPKPVPPAKPVSPPQSRPAPSGKRPVQPFLEDDDILELDDTPASHKQPPKPPPPQRPKPTGKQQKSKADGEDEFWSLMDDG